MWKLALALALDAAGAAFSPAAAAGPAPLPAFNVDIARTSVSGLSSGAFMAVQFEVAHSSIVKGAGVIAGGPYFCAQGSVITAVSLCSCTVIQPLCRVSDGGTDVPALVRATRRFERSGAIDATSNLSAHRVYLFSGTLDTLVPPPVMRDLARYYEQFMGADHIRFVGDVKAAHAMPTASYGNPCSTSDSPYIDRCGYDAAGELLKWIHGDLHPPRDGPLGGVFVEFDQTPFPRDRTVRGMDTSGWLYVPASCGAGKPCRLHIAFHGCRQGQSFSALPFGLGARFGRTFIEHAGYNRWADANDMIVLYPQAAATFTNPQGCWDWWGYGDADYAAKTGGQIAAVRAMVDRIGSGR
jgi:poly(3-hydroxybutyrate) depolymerase